jgi:hypothetical protein
LGGEESGYVRRIHHFIIFLLVVEVSVTVIHRRRSVAGNFQLFLLLMFFIFFEQPGLRCVIELIEGERRVANCTTSFSSSKWSRCKSPLAGE